MFQLVFKGECAPGADPAAARASARTLFKASVEQIERMFSGQPVVIRNRLEEDQALKYRAVLAKHGMRAYVQPMPGSSPSGPEAAERKPAPQTPARPSPPPGSPAQSTAASSADAPAVEPGDRLPVAGDKVDTILAGSGLSLDPVGVTLAEHHDVEAPMFQHLDDWTLAPAGTDLGVERDLPPPMVPDVSHLSLADEEPRGNQ
ncbi:MULTISPECIES: hypothetical protein [Marinobacter]|jgi:hypothetical protein|uniref:hypothetical protein n=1 Tax=Marinobacter TaxID=2742 RepID=UPI002006C1B8|nr:MULTISPECIES: hypothetical protein [Marinobacter]MCK7552760.1 hypothetical protein [Marinobacter goseongensis]MDV3504134.1 hypothetical protein [Marinobacter sp. M-5]